MAVYGDDLTFPLIYNDNISSSYAYTASIALNVYVSQSGQNVTLGNTQIIGSVAKNIKTVSGSYNIQPNDYTILCSGSFDVNISTVDDQRILNIKQIQNGETATVLCSAGIDYATTQSVLYPNSLSIHATNNQYFII